MSRSVVILFPLLALWLAFGLGDRSGGGKEERDNTASTASRRPGSEALDFNEKLTGRDRLLHRLAEPNLSSFDGSRHSGSQKALSPIPEDLAGTPKLVEMVWSEIDPKLRAKLSKSEEEELKQMIGRATGPDANSQPWVCWGPGVSQAKVAAYHEAEMLTGMSRSGVSLFANQFLGSGRWGRTASDGVVTRGQGRPTTLTWSVVPDGTEAPGLTIFSDAPSDLRQWLAGIYGGSASGAPAEQPWFEVFEAAFADLEKTSGVRFVYEPNDDGASLLDDPAGELGVRGDIRLAARYIDGFSGTLAFAYAPDSGDVVFDSGDGFFDLTSSSSLRLHNALTHELGHCLGLAHVCPVNETKLMEPLISLGFRGPQFDEYQSLQRQYGDVLEDHSDDRNNDSYLRATPLDLVKGGELEIPRLSIDDNSDVDYFKVDLLAGQLISFSVTPGEGSYMEGGQIGEDCSGDELFDSTRIHNLRLDLVSSNGSTVLASSNSAGLGEVEMLENAEIVLDGAYYIRVNGGNANAAQLYQLEVQLVDRPPEARLVHLGTSILTESGSVKNGWIDPGETVKIRFVLKNEGELATPEMTLSQSAGDGVTVFSSSFGNSRLAAGESSYLDVVVGSSGAFGDRLDLDVLVGFGGDLLLDISPDYRLGSFEETVSMDVDFDESSSLPDGWISSTVGSGVAWRISSSKFDSPIRSIYSAAVADVSEAIIESPAFVMSNGGANLTFSHLFRLEGAYDGGVLEVSRNGGEWMDLLESDVSVVSGGYNYTIATGFGSPIAGREAWSGSISEFISTSVDLPAEWAGESIRFRWRLAHDSSTSLEGWYLDNVKVVTSRQQSDPHLPALFLGRDGDFLDEGNPEAGVNLILSPELPLLSPVAFNLIASGTAMSPDYSATLSGVLPAGAAEVRVPIEVVVDSLVEGEEVLTLSLVDERPEYVAGAESSQSFTILDLRPVDLWMAGFFDDARPLTGDSDGDGMSELGEYLLGTDPTSRESVKLIELNPSSGGLLVPLTELPVREDASLGLEVSDDLMIWEAAEYNVVPGGLEVPRENLRGYLRLIFSLDE